MRVLIIGSGGREHALGWAIKRSPLAPELFALPGSHGLAGLGSCHAGRADDTHAVLRAVQELRIDLVVVGPEAPLVAGLADALRARDVRVFGPSARGAELEGSKVFAKGLMARHKIPTAAFQVIEDPAAAREYANGIRYPHVLKADGLAAGKGALIVRDREQARQVIESMMVARCFGEAGARVVFEEYLEGEERSVFAIAAGEHYRLLPPTQDYKRALDGDEGLNTGGMGAYAPVLTWTPALEMRVRREVIEPTLAALASEGRAYTGLLYAGLIIRDGDPKVIEFNCRFGDPETQALVPILRGDLLEALWAASDPQAATRGLPSLMHDGRFAACVVIAAGGYPGQVRKGDPIRGIDAASRVPDTLIFQAGTARREDGEIVTAGGRVLNVVGVGDDLPTALARAYGGAAETHFDGAFFRRDIAWRGLAALRQGMANTHGR
jgi:phosphoribosylamine--glycine ligase